ncbi:MAG: DAK2 domain-containing protein [Ornithinimicrobium sp.]|uniref:DAK2 domain-containing protein n=1 Tax=Ornithinimicrobium sp. TaxID=1977084 RepID=UPI0026DEBD9E|nr:DAK2 domain-containing protein [Ornithinimicrobium sp.]MDO5740328.1 DAK2 domain-containing protein [Ornithinimicrobium sp.]
MPAPVLDLVTARRWAVSARAVLAAAREQIDSLNVFPVADGDTGTNMYLTMDGALEFMRGQFEIGAGTDRLDEGLALIARGMLLAARGNSGVILSQLARGLAEAVGPHVEVAGPQELTLAFETAAQTAWDALAAPVEGTILSVARAAAEGARAAVDRGHPRDGEAAEELTVLDVVRAALERARLALAQTPSQLPALQIAGVVDAGGAGLVLVIEALEAVLEERPRPTVDDLPDWWVLPRAGATGPLPGPETGPECLAEGEDTGDVEVMYLLTDTDVQRADRLRAHLARIGSSVVVAGGPADYRVHVHLDEPRLAVEAGSFAGLVQDVRLTSLRDGQDLDAVRDAPDEAAPPAVTVVACGLGEGIEALLLEAGAQVVPSGPRRRASAGQLLAAMWASGSPHIIVLPNDADTLLVATAAAQEASREGLQVRVVPTATLVQGLAALAVLDADADPADLAQEMTEAARACSTGALTRADRDADTRVGPCRAGQWLGIVDDAIVAVHDEVAPVARVVTDLLCREGAEVLTVLTGQSARPEEVDPVLHEIEARHSGIEVVRIDGGQPTYPYLLGVE